MMPSISVWRQRRHLSPVHFLEVQADWLILLAEVEIVA